MPKKFTDEELKEGIQFTENNGQIVATFAAASVPTDPQKRQDALLANMAKLRAAGDKLKNIKISD